MRTGLNNTSADGKTIRVWDPMVRIFHWSLVVSFFGAYLLGEDGGQLHQILGYVALGLGAFRLVWGASGAVMRASAASSHLQAG